MCVRRDVDNEGATERGRARTRVTTENVQVPKPASYMGKKVGQGVTLVKTLVLIGSQSLVRFVGYIFVLIVERGRPFLFEVT